MVPIYNAPRHTNVISSHVMYKLKFLYEKSPMLKERIERHGNEDRSRIELRNNCVMCFPVWILLLLSASSPFGWPLSKLNENNSFPKTRQEEIDVHFIPPRNWRSMKVTMDSEYGLIIANEKWPVLSDQIIFELRFVHTLFYLNYSWS